MIKVSLNPNLLNLSLNAEGQEEAWYVKNVRFRFGLLLLLCYSHFEEYQLCLGTPTPNNLFSASPACLT